MSKKYAVRIRGSFVQSSRVPIEDALLERIKKLSAEEPKKWEIEIEWLELIKQELGTISSKLFDRNFFSKHSEEDIRLFLSKVVLPIGNIFRNAPRFYLRDNFSLVTKSNCAQAIKNAFDNRCEELLFVDESFFIYVSYFRNDVTLFYNEDLDYEFIDDLFENVLFDYITDLDIKENFYPLNYELPKNCKNRPIEYLKSLFSDCVSNLVENAEDEIEESVKTLCSVLTDSDAKFSWFNAHLASCLFRMWVWRTNDIYKGGYRHEIQLNLISILAMLPRNISKLDRLFPENNLHDHLNYHILLNMIFNSIVQFRNKPPYLDDNAVKKMLRRGSDEDFLGFISKGCSIFHSCSQHDSQGTQSVFATDILKFYANYNFSQAIKEKQLSVSEVKRIIIIRFISLLFQASNIKNFPHLELPNFSKISLNVRSSGLFSIELIYKDLQPIKFELSSRIYGPTPKCYSIFMLLVEQGNLKFAELLVDTFDKLEFLLPLHDYFVNTQDAHRSVTDATGSSIVNEISLLNYVLRSAEKQRSYSVAIKLFDKFFTKANLEKFLANLLQKTHVLEGDYERMLVFVAQYGKKHGWTDRYRVLKKFAAENKKRIQPKPVDFAMRYRIDRMFKRENIPVSFLCNLVLQKKIRVVLHSEKKYLWIDTLYGPLPKANCGCIDISGMFTKLLTFYQKNPDKGKECVKVCHWFVDNFDRENLVVNTSNMVFFKQLLSVGMESVAALVLKKYFKPSECMGPLLVALGLKSSSMLKFILKKANNFDKKFLCTFAVNVRIESFDKIAFKKMRSERVPKNFNSDLSFVMHYMVKNDLHEISYMFLMKFIGDITKKDRGLYFLRIVSSSGFGVSVAQKFIAENYKNGNLPFPTILAILKADLLKKATANSYNALRHYNVLELLDPDMVAEVSRPKPKIIEIKPKINGGSAKKKRRKKKKSSRRANNISRKPVKQNNHNNTTKPKRKELTKEELLFQQMIVQEEKMKKEIEEQMRKTREVEVEKKQLSTIKEMFIKNETTCTDFIKILNTFPKFASNISEIKDNDRKLLKFISLSENSGGYEKTVPNIAKTYREEQLRRKIAAETRLLKGIKSIFTQYEISSQEFIKTLAFFPNLVPRISGTDGDDQKLLKFISVVANSGGYKTVVPRIIKKYYAEHSALRELQHQEINLLEDVPGEYISVAKQLNAMFFGGLFRNKLNAYFAKQTPTFSHDYDLITLFPEHELLRKLKQLQSERKCRCFGKKGFGSRLHYRIEFFDENSMDVKFTNNSFKTREEFVVTHARTLDFARNAIHVTYEGEIIDPMKGVLAIKNNILIPLQGNWCQKDNIQMFRALRFVFQDDLPVATNGSDKIEGGNEFISQFTKPNSKEVVLPNRFDSASHNSKILQEIKDNKECFYPEFPETRDLYLIINNLDKLFLTGNGVKLFDNLLEHKLLIYVLPTTAPRLKNFEPKVGGRQELEQKYTISEYSPEELKQIRVVLSTIDFAVKQQNVDISASRFMFYSALLKPLIVRKMTYRPKFEATVRCFTKHPKDNLIFGLMSLLPPPQYDSHLVSQNVFCGSGCFRKHGGVGVGRGRSYYGNYNHFHRSNRKDGGRGRRQGTGSSYVVKNKIM